MAEDPAYALRFEERGDYLYAFVSGEEDSLAVSKRFWAAIHARSVELGHDRILVEEDFPNQLSTMEMYTLAEYIAEMFHNAARVAHVDRRLSDMELNAFGETVAVNRLLCARVFNSHAAAEAWLRE